MVTLFKRPGAEEGLDARIAGERGRTAARPGNAGGWSIRRCSDAEHPRPDSAGGIDSARISRGRAHRRA
jgi:hypothetical protein